MVDIIKSRLTATSGTKTTGKPDVVILLDASGSMSPYIETVVSTFNEYVASVKNTANSISLYMFSDRGIFEKLYKEHPARIRKLSKEDYCPDGGTPLYDAMGKVIKKFEDSTRNVQFVTHTDGEENSSKEWSFTSIQAYIELFVKKGWLFVYLGEGLKAVEQFKYFSGLKMKFSENTRGATLDTLSQATQVYNMTCSNATATYTGSNLDILDIDKGEKIIAP